jgi:hypothetical protein
MFAQPFRARGQVVELMIQILARYEFVWTLVDPPIQGYCLTGLRSFHALRRDSRFRFAI